MVFFQSVHNAQRLNFMFHDVKIVKSKYSALRTNAFNENEYEKNEIKQGGFRLDEGVNPSVYPQRMWSIVGKRDGWFLY